MSAAPPVFILGAPRSGTTLLYKVLCLHPEAAYISNWVRRFPGIPAVAAVHRGVRYAPDRQLAAWFGPDSNAYSYGRSRGALERAFPAPVEGEPIFRRCGLGVDEVDSGGARRQPVTIRRAFRQLKRWSGGDVVVSKRIDHNRRVVRLLDEFPDARFVAVVRDGRAVAASLAKVDWWPTFPVWWWHDGSPQAWDRLGRDPWELRARHWVEECRAMEEGLAEVPAEQVLRVRYEEITHDPLTVFEHVANWSGLAPEPAWRDHLARLSFPDRNEAWRRGLDDETVERIDRYQSRLLSTYGYP
jgi:Sulfotransferase family